MDIKWQNHWDELRHYGLLSAVPGRWAMLIGLQISIFGSIANGQTWNICGHRHDEYVWICCIHWLYDRDCSWNTKSWLDMAAIALVTPATFHRAGITTGAPLPLSCGVAGKRLWSSSRNFSWSLEEIERGNVQPIIQPLGRLVEGDIQHGNMSFGGAQVTRNTRLDDRPLDIAMYCYIISSGLPSRAVLAPLLSPLPCQPIMAEGNAAPVAEGVFFFPCQSVDIFVLRVSMSHMKPSQKRAICSLCRYTF